jgi:hypothetical protein
MIRQNIQPQRRRTPNVYALRGHRTRCGNEPTTHASAVDATEQPQQQG